MSTGLLIPKIYMPDQISEQLKKIIIKSVTPDASV